MRALLEDMKSGQVAAYDVPAPELQEGGILVRTAFSAISAGTEKATVEAGRKSLLGKAMARPDLVKQVLEYAQSNGIEAARQKVQARLETLSALGYSCSGLCWRRVPASPAFNRAIGSLAEAAAMPATARSTLCPQISPFAFPIM